MIAITKAMEPNTVTEIKPIFSGVAIMVEVTFKTVASRARSRVSRTHVGWDITVAEEPMGRCNRKDRLSPLGE